MINVVDTRGAADYTGLATSTLEKMRVFGGGPRYLKLGRAVRYRPADLEVWLSERTVANTSQRLSQDGDGRREGPDAIPWNAIDA